MNLGETIKELREKVGISPPELAVKCGISPTHMYDVEDGKRNPSEKLLRKLANHLNTDLEPLLNSLRARKEIIRKVRRNPEEFQAFLEEK